MGAEHAADGQVHYVVRDNGIGFDMAMATLALSGPGAGLTTVQRIVALHGGASSAAYFDCPGHPELSLLALGAAVALRQRAPA